MSSVQEKIEQFNNPKSSEQVVRPTLDLGNDGHVGSIVDGIESTKKSRAEQGIQSTDLHTQINSIKNIIQVIIKYFDSNNSAESLKQQLDRMEALQQRHGKLFTNATTALQGMNTENNMDALKGDISELTQRHADLQKQREQLQNEIPPIIEDMKKLLGNFEGYTDPEFSSSRGGRQRPRRRSKKYVS